MSGWLSKSKVNHWAVAALLGCLFIGSACTPKVEEGTAPKPAASPTAVTVAPSPEAQAEAETKDGKGNDDALAEPVKEEAIPDDNGIITEDVLKGIEALDGSERNVRSFNQDYCTVDQIHEAALALGVYLKNIGAKHPVEAKIYQALAPYAPFMGEYLQAYAEQVCQGKKPAFSSPVKMAYYNYLFGTSASAQKTLQAIREYVVHLATEYFRDNPSSKWDSCPLCGHKFAKTANGGYECSSCKVGGTEPGKNGDPKEPCRVAVAQVWVGDPFLNVFDGFLGEAFAGRPAEGGNVLYYGAFMGRALPAIEKAVGPKGRVRITNEDASCNEWLTSWAKSMQWGNVTITDDTSFLKEPPRHEFDCALLIDVPRLTMGQAVNNSLISLKPGGKLIFAEGVDVAPHLEFDILYEMQHAKDILSHFGYKFEKQLKLPGNAPAGAYALMFSRPAEAAAKSSQPSKP